MTTQSAALQGHTPGHWSFQRDTERTIQITRNGTRLAEVIDSRPYGEAEANARLIAAAPDLLASLIKTVALLEIATLNGNSLYGATCTQVARETIAKATA